MTNFLHPATRLAAARAADRPGSRVPHSVVLLPSFSVSASMLAAYGHRIPALEHRQLLSLLTLPRLPAAQYVLLTCLRPANRVLDYYLSLVPPEHRRDMRARVRIIEVPDRSHRSITAKLLDRPDLVELIRVMTRDRLAYIDPWNVTELEMELSRRLDLPLNGPAADLWPLGFKSNGRRVMRAAGVPLPVGAEDVRSVADVVAAVADIRRSRPQATAAVVKTDTGATGNGNRVVRFGPATTERQVREAVKALGERYLADLAGGGVVEELVVGTRFSSPSVQVDLAPGRVVQILSTHEQLFDGPDDQVYFGCRFPAAPDYSRELAGYGASVGRVLAEYGAVGRLGVDFAAVQGPSGDWRLYGLEINLRKSGTNHPLLLLQGLVPGRYDPSAGRWLSQDGSPRFYVSTDNLVDPAWVGRSPATVIQAIRGAGLEFGRQTQTGVVLHMFSGLDIDGRLGLTAIGSSEPGAQLLYDAAVAALSAPAVPTSGKLPLPA